MGIYMKTKCVGGRVGMGETPWIDIRARGSGWDIDGDYEQAGTSTSWTRLTLQSPEWHWRAWRTLEIFHARKL